MAKQPKPSEVDKTPKEDRAQLNQRARFDYGILNAEDMSVKQLKSEMKTIDDQSKSTDNAGTSETDNA